MAELVVVCVTTIICVFAVCAAFGNLKGDE